MASQPILRSEAHLFKTHWRSLHLVESGYYAILVGHSLWGLAFCTRCCPKAKSETGEAHSIARSCSFHSGKLNVFVYVCIYLFICSVTIVSTCWVAFVLNNWYRVKKNRHKLFPSGALPAAFPNVACCVFMLGHLEAPQGQETIHLLESGRCITMVSPFNHYGMLLALPAVHDFIISSRPASSLIQLMVSRSPQFILKTQACPLPKV